MSSAIDYRVLPHGEERKGPKSSPGKRQTLRRIFSISEKKEELSKGIGAIETEIATRSKGPSPQS